MNRLSRTAIITIIILLPFLTGIGAGNLPITVDKPRMDLQKTSTAPVCEWSFTDSDTVVGPNAPIMVFWSGGDYPIVKNTLEFQVGESIFRKTGTITQEDYDAYDNSNTTSERCCHMFPTYLQEGNYYFELTWNDPQTDLSGYISTDPDTNKPWWSDVTFYWNLGTLSFPETYYGYIDESREYYIYVYWFNDTFVNSRLPVDYLFFVGDSADYFLRQSHVDGNNQTFNTAELPDDTYQVTSICFDSEGNNYTDTVTLTTYNQFPPQLEWVKYNGHTEDGMEIQRGSELTFEWNASDPNPGEDIYVTMHCQKPGAYSYSILFSSFILSITNNYTINWDSSWFTRNGKYRFKIEVNNFNLEPVEPFYFYFYIVDDSTTNMETETTISTNDPGGTSNSVPATNPHLTSTPGLAMLAALSGLILAAVLTRKRKR